MCCSALNQLLIVNKFSIWVLLILVIAPITYHQSAATLLDQLPTLNAQDRHANQLPTLPSVQQQTQLKANGLRVRVNAFQLIGNTVFSDDELLVITEPYTHRYVSSEVLEAVRHALTLHYVNQGYINSGVVIPDQNLSSGVVTLQIVEGKLNAIRVTGSQRLKPEFVRDRFAFSSEGPLNIARLQDQLQLLLQRPFIDRINAELAPGNRLGEADLIAHVTESKRPYTASFTLDNRLSPNVGTVRGVLSSEVYSLSGMGDTFGGNVAYAEGLNNASLYYSLPLSASDITLDVNANYATSHVIDPSVADFIDITSQTWTVGFRLTHPLRQTLNERLFFSIGLDRHHSETALNDLGFGFSKGVPENGQSDVSVVRMAHDGLRRNTSNVTAFRSTVSLGLDVLDATTNANTLPDSRFLAWLGQFQWAQRVVNYHQLVFRLDGQVTTRPLLPMEQFGVGGKLSVRGYRENQLVRDYGYIASIEYRMPLPALKLNFQGGRPLELAVFLDSGGGWYLASEETGPTTVSSVGLGLRWDPVRYVHTEWFWGYALDEINNTGEQSLQDSGIHFSLQTSF